MAVKSVKHKFEFEKKIIYVYDKLEIVNVIIDGW